MARRAKVSPVRAPTYLSDSFRGDEAARCTPVARFRSGGRRTRRSAVCPTGKVVPGERAGAARAHATKNRFRPRVLRSLHATTEPSPRPPRLPSSRGSRSCRTRLSERSLPMVNRRLVEARMRPPTPTECVRSHDLRRHAIPKARIGVSAVRYSTVAQRSGARRRQIVASVTVQFAENGSVEHGRFLGRHQDRRLARRTGYRL